MKSVILTLIFATLICGKYFSQNEKFVFDISGVTCFDDNGLTNQYSFSQSIVIDENNVTIYSGDKVSKERIISTNTKNSEDFGDVLSIISINEAGKQFQYMIFVNQNKNNKVELSMITNSGETCFFESKFILH